MDKKVKNNARLGVFVLSGLVFLVLLLYMIGKNRNLFGHTYELKARFNNAKGLITGNNVRYAGIDVGTVREIQILNDTVIEVTLIVEDKMQSIIKKNAVAWIGSEGIVGNKVVHIQANPEPADLAVEGDILLTKKGVDTDEMMDVLSETNYEVATLVRSLQSTVERINNSTALWSLLNDQSIPENLRASVLNIKKTASHAESVVGSMDIIVTDVQQGKGSVGALLKDTSMIIDIRQAIEGMRQMEQKANNLASELDTLVADIAGDIRHGSGPANMLLHDTAVVNKLNASLSNLESGTKSFDENMEALKHNFLFRGYFRKQEKKKQKEAEAR